MRQVRGEFAMGSHLALKVTVEGQDWLCDVGFGSTQLAPLPFAAGTWAEAPLAGELGQVEDGYWRLAITEGPMPLSYDFHDQPAEEARLETLCAWQASDPESIFVQNLVVQQRRSGGHDMLRGKVLTLTRADGSEERELGSAEELVAELRDRFGLDLPQVAALWPQVEERHAALVGFEEGKLLRGRLAVGVGFDEHRELAVLHMGYGHVAVVCSTFVES